MNSTNYENLNNIIGEEEVLSGTSSFTIIKRKVNDKLKTILKYSIELDIDNASIEEAITEFSRLLERAYRRVN